MKSKAAKTRHYRRMMYSINHPIVSAQRPSRKKEVKPIPKVAKLWRTMEREQKRLERKNVGNQNQ